LLTGTQIRMARAALGWSAQVLAEKAGLSYGAIQKAEAIDGLPNMLAKNLLAVKTALEKGGVVFLDGDYSGRGGPGVRLRK
jgi:transcriptional regulator with XRE-family HTH domain